MCSIFRRNWRYMIGTCSYRRRGFSTHSKQTSASARSTPTWRNFGGQNCGTRHESRTAARRKGFTGRWNKSTVGLTKKWYETEDERQRSDSTTHPKRPTFSGDPGADRRGEVQGASHCDPGLEIA